ncbi:MAG: hypothetical protein DRQ58_07130 [Gammaproteobacteria bacterium]|nr:MAG: hypothetical protein DRQ58_07130 [Gammaproteobacteria bacterium]
MTPASMIERFLKNADQLRFRNLFFMVVGLFFVDLLLPDFIPFIDEIILGLIAIILANWKKERNQDKEDKVIEDEVIEGDIIEGEIVNDDEDKIH